MSAASGIATPCTPSRSVRTGSGRGGIQGRLLSPTGPGREDQQDDEQAPQLGPEAEHLVGLEAPWVVARRQRHDGLSARPRAAPSPRRCSAREPAARDAQEPFGAGPLGCNPGCDLHLGPSAGMEASHHPTPAIQQKDRASGPGATTLETGRLRSELVAVRIQPGRFALASRMRISSTSASNPGASAATMAAASMAS